MFGSDNVEPFASTLHFINKDGWAVTCGHVAQLLAAADTLAQQRQAFRNELNAASAVSKGNINQLRKRLAQKYNWKSDTVVDIKNRFTNCVDGQLLFDWHVHPSVDLALIQFKSYNRLLCDEFPIFPADTSSLSAGRSLCRLGFPFAEFTNFTYNKLTEEIEWTQTGQAATPYFPLEGMLTRFLVDASGRVMGFELSTPGLRGQSGGPVFDVNGQVWGVQFATKALDLNFDVDLEVWRQCKKKRIHESAVLHVGHCVHVDVVKEFMRSKGVVFAEQ